MKIKFLIIALLLFSKSIGQVIVKNNSPYKIFVAIGFFDKQSGWTTKGWFNIETKSQETVYQPKLFGNQNFYYCAKIDNCDQGFYGKSSLLVDEINAFTINNADKEYSGTNRDFKKYNFIEYQISNLEENVILIDPLNLKCNNKKQGKWKLGLDKEGNFAELEEDIKFYREINFENDKPIGWCKDFYANGTIKSEYKLSSFSPFIYDGRCTWYSENGNKSRETIYRNGVPSEEVLVSDNGNVIEKKAKRSVVKLPVQNVYLNSTSNEFWKGGNSKSLIPVNLPEGTVEWYYEYTASRDASEVKKVTEQFNLAAQLSSILDKTGAAEIAINALTSPPGTDFCDMYLLENDYYNQFLKDQEFIHYPAGARQNFKSGIIQVKNLSLQKPLIGVKNKDMSYGINVSIQVVAIVSKL